MSTPPWSRPSARTVCALSVVFSVAWASSNVSASALVGPELEPAPPHIESIPARIHALGVTAKANGYAFAWTEQVAGEPVWRLFFGALDATGAQATPWKTLVHQEASSSPERVFVATTAGGYGVGAEVGGQPAVFWLDGSGQPTGAQPAVFTGTAQTIHTPNDFPLGLSALGNDVWLLWTSFELSTPEKYGQPNRLYLSLVHPDGTVGAQLLIAGPLGPPDPGAPFESPSIEADCAAGGAGTPAVMVAWIERFRTQACTTIVNGSGWVIGEDCHEQSDVRMARIGANGGVLTAPVPIAPALAVNDSQMYESVRVVWGGGMWWVLWTADDWSAGIPGTTTLYFRRFDAAGNAVDPAGVAVTTGVPPSFVASYAQGGPVIAWTGSQTTSLVALDANGNVRHGGTLTHALGGYAYDESVACAGGACLYAAADDETVARGLRYDDASGGVTDVSPLVTGQQQATSDQKVPVAAAGPTSFLLAWYDGRSDAPGIYGALIDAAGAAPTGLLVAKADAGDPVLGLSAQRGDGAWLLGWQAGFSSVRVVRVGFDGAVLDAAPVVFDTVADPASEDLSGIALAPAGTGWLAATRYHKEFCVSYGVWGDCNQWGDTYSFELRRLDASGAWVDASPVTYEPGWDSYGAPALGGQGSEWAMGFAGYASSSSYAPSVVGATLLGDASGSPAPVGGVHVVAQADSTQSLGGPWMASGPAPWLVAWTKGPPAQDARTVQVAALAADGTVGTVYDAASGGAGAWWHKVAIARAGAGGALAWVASDGGGGHVVRAMRLDASGAPLDTGGFAVSDPVDVGPSAGLSAAHDDGTGQLLVAYTRRDATDPYGGRWRVRYHLVSFADAAGAPCLSDAHCASGHCVDGVCCDTACGGGALDDCVACSVAAGAAADGICGPLQAGPCTLGLSAVSPAAGEPGAHRVLTLSGSGFTPATQVVVPGGSVQSVTFVSATELRVDVTLPQAEGTWDVTVHTDEVVPPIDATLPGVLTTRQAACPGILCAGACANDTDCVDGDPCTADTCVAGSCHHALDTPACCAPAPLGACGTCMIGGDVDANGQVSIVDLQCGILTSLWLLGGKVSAVPQCAVRPLDTLDDNCDGQVDVTDLQVLILRVLDLPLSSAQDGDGDGCIDACATDSDGDGTFDHLDCSPLDPSIHPGAAEACNGLDDDCDGTTDPPVPSVAASCDDGDPCTTEGCDAGSCTHTPAPGAPCPNVDPCAATSTCAPDALDPTVLTCQVQTPIACCQWSSYQDPFTGDVQWWLTPKPDGAPCEDGNLCTTGETCHSLACGGGVFVDCTDAASCAAAVCDPATGQCLSDPAQWPPLPLPSGNSGSVTACARGDVPAPPSPGGASYAWSAADCGGALPPVGSVGVLSKAVECGTDDDWGVRSPPPLDATAGVDWWIDAPCGPADLRSVYLAPADGLGYDVVVCQARCSAFPAADGAQTHVFTAAECGGTLPPVSAVGVLARARRCGSDTSWEVLDPAAPQGAGVSYSVSGGCAGIDVRVAYVDRSHPAWSSAVVCTHEGGEAVPQGSVTYTFAASECEGSLPPSGAVGVLAAGRSCAGAEDWAVLDPSDAGGPGVTFWSRTACTGPVRYRAIYFVP